MTVITLKALKCVLTGMDPGMDPGVPVSDLTGGSGTGSGTGAKFSSGLVLSWSPYCSPHLTKNKVIFAHLKWRK